MNSRRQSTAEWIQQSLSDTEKPGKCFAIALVHYQGTQPTELDKVKFPNETMSVGDIADRFDLRAREHCRDLPGQQMLALYAFYGTSNEPGATRPFSITGALEHPGLMSEAPTPAGLTQQAMRHAEIAIQSSMGGIREIVAGFRELAAAQSANQAKLIEENEKLRHENTDAWMMVRNIGLQQRAEDYEQAMKLKKEERTNLLISRVIKWAPALVNTIVGRKVFPQNEEDTAIVEGLLSEMQPEHIALLSSVAPPAVMGLVSARAKQIFSDREAASNAANEARELEASGGNAAAEGELQ